MRYLKLLILILLTYVSKAQMAIVDYSCIEKHIKSHTDSVLIINFWATSCKPCIEEFPYFIETHKVLNSEKVKFIYVSLDFAKLRDKAEAFVQKRGIIGIHYLLKDDPNVWINKVDKDWGGDIPYTLLVTKEGKYIKHDSKFNSSDELNKFIRQHLK